MSYFLSQVQSAQEVVSHIFKPTPLQWSEYLSTKYGAKIYLKREDLTPVRSYKLRGALWFFHQILSQKTRFSNFACASAGNHSQGFAFACQFHQVKGVIYMPTTTPAQKINKTRYYGGDFVEIRLVGDIFDESLAAANKYAKENKALVVPPFDHEWIIEGQATVAQEICNMFVPDAVVLPVGGGGLSAGVCQYFREKSPETLLFFAEPKGAASLFTSLEANQQITLDEVDTFVDGAAVARIGDHNWKSLSSLSLDKVFTAPSNRISQTILQFLSSEGIIMEPAGALSVDILEDIFSDKNFAKILKNKKIVCVVSGGNLDFSRLADLEERKMKWERLKKYIILKLPQRPGALREFLSCLGAEDDICRFEYLKKSAKIFGSVLVGIETKNPKNFDKIFDSMNRTGFSYRDVTDDETLFDFVV